MNLDTALKYIPSKKAVLFLGAGFSREATSAGGGTIPSGAGLSALMCEEMGVPPKLSLEVASREFLRNPTPERVARYVEIMRENCRASAVRDYHRDTVNANWKAIYTTNYDDVVEVAEKSLHVGLRSISRYSPFRYYDQEIPVVHLHGYIADLNEQNYRDCLVISHDQILEHRTDHEHWKFFEMDAFKASAIFLVGFRAEDLHIEKYLYAATREDKKCFSFYRRVPRMTWTCGTDARSWESCCSKEQRHSQREYLTAFR
ncbi:MAG: SIR2 family protein [Fimbriimonadaceae bacterium]